jgi:hypothetical protein
VTPGGPHVYYSGPQSYNDAAASTVSGSFNDLDFAYALQRPGVIPMGESYTSSVNMSNAHLGSGSAPHIIRQQSSESYESRQNIVSTVSRSFEDGDIRNTSNGDVYRNGRFTYSSSHDDRVAEGFSHNSEYLKVVNGSSNIEGIHQQSAQEFHQMLPPNSLPPRNSNDFALQSNLNDDNSNSQGSPRHHQSTIGPFGSLDAQTFFQQQQAALQQQQLILRQQQAALALQQEQLRAYGMNYITTPGGTSNIVPGMVGGLQFRNTVAGMEAVGGMNGQQNYQQHGFASVGGEINGGVTRANVPSSLSTSLVPGGYCYVTAADGSPVLVQLNPAPNQLHSHFHNQMIGQVTAAQASLPNIVGGFANTLPLQQFQGVSLPQGAYSSGTAHYPVTNQVFEDNSVRQVNNPN